MSVNENLCHACGVRGIPADAKSHTCRPDRDGYSGQNYRIRVNEEGSSSVTFATDRQKEGQTPAPADLIEFFKWQNPNQTVAVHGVVGDGLIDVPYLTWVRREDDHGLSLILDHRFILDLPEMTPWEEQHIVEFIANAIAIGGGYPSIYYTKHRLAFRG